MAWSPDHSLFTTHTHTHTHAHTSSLSLSLSLSLPLFVWLSFFVSLRRIAMEPSSPKKIQFDVPPLQGHLDPQAAEHIRRRRPTPATLQIYRQPEAGDQHDVSGGSQCGDGARRRQSALAPPTTKGLHVGVEHPLAGGPDRHLSPSSTQHSAGSFPWTNRNGPEEANGNLVANHGRGVAQSNSCHDVSCESQKEASSPDSVSR
ncbi:protein phosphatase 1 regulatory subunit 1A-like isoform X2 [Hippocampus zosterae]|uniref:protein phosphatase 1 regulatory subunit 1A-like isoform X2 n=1 Tax=Hippocampus zosterae TaxID=109293 RepID=UPI00223DB04B|nr:protein phosphatase 1 regulatory subunit 1A-like isoform X2 [Hippocampus zosterae]